MSFWDSSAVLPLSVEEPLSAPVRQLGRTLGAPVVWWACMVECCSALERRRRAGQLNFQQKGQAERLLHQLAAAWMEMHPTLALRERAIRLLAAHDLRASDALQLAAALLWAAERPSGRVFVCLDARLREAAQREGFTVLPEALPYL